MTVGLAALGGYLYTQAGAKAPVVMVVRQVPVGQVIERQDLTTVDVSGAVTALGAARLPQAVGQRAAVTLVPNTLLQRAMLTAAVPLPAGQAQVGVALKGGLVPADGVAPGDVVQVVQVPAKDAASTRPSVVSTGSVFSSRPDPALTGGTLVTVTVPTADAPLVAAASGLGAVALVKVPAS